MDRYCCNNLRFIVLVARNIRFHMANYLEPMKKVAKTVRRHKPLILNWFKAKNAYSSGIVEGLNTKIKLTTRKSYGFRTYSQNL